MLRGFRIHLTREVVHMNRKLSKSAAKRREVMKYTSDFEGAPYEFREQIYDGLGKMAEQIAKDVDEECLKIMMEKMKEGE